MGILCIEAYRLPFELNIFCLFELMLYVPVNSNGHVGMLSPFYGTYPPLECHDTQNMHH